MQPQLNIPEQLLNNKTVFDDDFFTSRPLSLPNQDLRLPNGQLRRYHFPTYFKDVAFSAGIFFADYNKVTEQLPKGHLKPVSVPGGRAMVIVASYHYRQIHEMPGYNEVLVMVPVLHKSLSIPLIPPLLNNYPGMGYYILALPMTNLENQLRGQQFWGLPKSLHEVDISKIQGGSVTTIHDEGVLDFELSIRNIPNIPNRVNVPTVRKEKYTEKRNYIYSMTENKLIKFESHFAGNLTSTSNWSALWNGKNQLAKSTGTLTLGNSSLANKLKELNINPNAFQTRYCASLKSCLYLPDDSF